MSMIKCPYCGKMNYDINDWCLNCKVDLKKGRSINIPVTVCHACNSLNIGAFQYCTFCGDYLKNMESARVYDKEELVLARHVVDLPQEEALFYSRENNVLNKSLYIRKISELEGHLKRYREKIVYQEANSNAETKDPVGQAVNKVIETVKNKVRSSFAEKNSEETFETHEEPGIVEPVCDGAKNNAVSGERAVDAACAGEAGYARQSKDSFETAQHVKSSSAGISERGHKTAAAAKNVRELSEVFIGICKERFSDNMMFSQLKPKIENRIKSEDEYTLSMYGNGKTSEQIVYLIIADILSAEFARTGDCYLFKSVLSMKGKELLRAWHLTARELLRNGGYSQAEYDNAEKRIGDIANNGGAS